MFLAEIDPIQVIIIVIAMGAGFVQWIWGLLKQNLEESKRSNEPVNSGEDNAAREAARRRILQHQRPSRPSPKAPPPVNDPWSSVRDVFDQIKEEARNAQNPAMPPPVPAPVDRPRRGTVRAELQPASAPPPVPAVAFPTGSVKPPPPIFFSTPPTPRMIERSRPAAEFGGLRDLLLSSTSARQAVLLKEILGPPKALQSFEDSPF